MARFYGTKGADRILQHFLSSGIVTEPKGLDGTRSSIGNVIYGYGGADFIEAGVGGIIGNVVFGGSGDDTIVGGNDLSICRAVIVFMEVRDQIRSMPSMARTL